VSSICASLVQLSLAAYSLIYLLCEDNRVLVTACTCSIFQVFGRVSNLSALYVDKLETSSLKCLFEVQDRPVYGVAKFVRRTDYGYYHSLRRQCIL
jgi:hypothetical protein